MKGKGVIMRTALKRVIGVVLVVAMTAGILCGLDISVTNAEENTNAGVVLGNVSENVSLSANSNGTVYYYQNSSVGLDLLYTANGSTIEPLKLYMKVQLNNEEAVTAFNTCHIELANTSTGHDTSEIEWTLPSGQVTYVENQTEYEVYLDFSEGSKHETGKAIDYTQTMNWFRIFSTKTDNFGGFSGVKFLEIKVVSTAPTVTTKYNNAVAGIQPANGYDDKNYVFSGWFTDVMTSTPYQGNTAGEAYAKFVTQDVLGLKSQFQLETVSDSDMFVLASCDGTKTISNGITHTLISNGTESNGRVDDGDFMEGTGSVCSTASNQIFAKIESSAAYDISKYQGTGKLHFWLKLIDNNGALTGKTVYVQFSDDQNFSGNKLTWTIPADELPIGAWKEFNLNICDATPTGTVANMQYFRMYYSSSLENVSCTFYLDDVRLVEGLDGVIFDECDSDSDKTTVGSGNLPVPSTSQYIQGTKAYPLNENQVGAHYGLDTTINASMYVEDGYLHMWLYNDTDWSESTAKLVVELGSTCDKYPSGQDGRACVRFQKPLKDLSIGWNELDFELNNPSWRSETQVESVTDSTQRPAIEWNTVKRIKVYTSTGSFSGGMYLDDIQIVSGNDKAPHGVGAETSRKATLRFITSVDSLNYTNAGFDIKIGNQANEKPYVSTKVFESLYAFDGVTNLNLDPESIFASPSLYFSTFRINNIPDTALETVIYVTPKWTTRDGTPVTGITKQGTVMDWIQGKTTVVE